MPGEQPAPQTIQRLAFAAFPSLAMLAGIQLDVFTALGGGPRTAELAPGGEIVIIGRILDDSRLSPPDTVLTNLVFLNIFDAGRAHTEGDHRRWLEGAGFVDIEREVEPGGRGLIRARKPSLERP